MAEITQQMIDAGRRLMTAKERAVYAATSRRWLPASILGPEAILDKLVDKGWLDYTRDAENHCWVYQRRHSLD